MAQSRATTILPTLVAPLQVIPYSQYQRETLTHRATHLTINSVQASKPEYLRWIATYLPVPQQMQLIPADLLLVNAPYLRSMVNIVTVKSYFGVSR